jgi:uncharacterized protein (DUF924 family)
MTHTGLHSPDHVTAAKKPRNRSTRRCVQCLRQAGTERWFAEDPTFDSDFRQRSKPLTLLRPPASWMTVSIRQRVRWPSWGTSIGFPRNSFGNTRHMFATDRLALRFARIAVDHGLDVQIEQELRCSSIFRSSTPRTLRMRIRAVRLCHASLDAEAIRYAHIRQDIITARFGRFPHRNPGFGRDMTPEEQAFLEEGGFAG